MTDYPRTARDAAEFMDNLVYSDSPPVDVPPAPGEDVLVVRSYRLPLALDQRIKSAAADRGVPASALVRDWLEAGVAALADDQLISRADALRALASLHPLRQTDPSA